MTSAAALPEPSELSSSVIYQELRRRIIKGELAPGARLRERTLAEEFRVSRIPIRDAIPQLEAEGFITTLPRRGAVVSTLTMRDVDELFEVRLGVEVFANRLAAERAAAGADTTGLEEALQDCDDAVAIGDPEQLQHCNTALHLAIIDLCGNQLLQSMLRMAMGRERWIFHMTGGSDPVMSTSEHHVMCDAIIAGDADLAAALAYSHIAERRRPTIDALKEKLDPAPS